MRLFVFWMLVASIVGFLKTFALAQILSLSEFGHYVSLAGIALLSGTLLSFGLVEGTIKRYPRLWVARDLTLILQDAKAVCRSLAVRFSLAILIVAAVASSYPTLYSPADFVLVGIWGFGSATLSLIASVLRAADSPGVFLSFSLYRSALSLGTALVGASLYSWRGAMVGELIAMALTLGASRLSIRFAYRVPDRQLPSVRLRKAPGVQPRRRGGMRLYFAALCSSSTTTVDRAFVNASLGSAAAGTYGAIALIFQVGQLLVNILVQRLGPIMIKESYAGDERRMGRTRLLRAGALVALASVALIAAALGLKRMDIPEGFFAKYSISDFAIVMAGLIGILQIYGLMEFKLVAIDREDLVLFASTLACAVFFGLFAAGGIFKLPLEWFISFVFCAKLVHVSVLLAMIRSSSDPDRLRGS